ncbi:hypothetical protein [Alicyclobacillus sendaiensis]|uniref:Uncharacterized protein n=1 Tax=Alicyclobacillus sendaiensis PA2 TaxID=3029425 RepID=A0ABT6Y1M3_ALISE|nr:hypothetical protein [Alicyclobacillus sendaiensis]MDI9261228.1 hypothetical protein [Alicyclobacillus sendaiensis PA2]
MNRRKVWKKRLRRLLLPWRKERVWIPIDPPERRQPPATPEAEMWEDDYP